MKYLITESQYSRLMESQEIIDNLLDKISEKGYDSLSIDEKRYLQAYSEHTKKGGRPDEFVDPSEVYDEREGMVIDGEIAGMPIQFTFSEERKTDIETEYFGEIKFDGEEYLGVISTDKNGYLTDYDFFNVSSNDDVRLQDVIEGLDYEFTVFLSDEVIPMLLK
jgi:hypothetical protein